MKKMQMLALVGLMTVSSLAMGQSKRDKNSDLEKLLWDADQEWLCAGPYLKGPKECVESRANFWSEQFFEIGGAGTVMSKAQMVASQTAAAPNTVAGTGLNGVFPGEFRLRAVYGKFALATDRTAFKTLDASGLPAFTSSTRWLRLFVYENGRWRPAAGAGVPVVRRPATPGVAPAPPQQTTGNHRSPNEQLEKELAAIDTKWLDSAMHQKWDYLNELFTDQWFEILGWDPTTEVTKAYAQEAIMRPRPNAKPGEGVFPDQFELWADYGDVALATDRRTRHWTDAHGNSVTTPHRTLLVFVKQDGQWKSAATALVPYMAP
jgi:hypothetical protein